MSDTIHWYGHATIGLETSGSLIVIDPFFSDNPATDLDADHINPQFILVTHGHHDHIGDTVAIAKRTGALVISNAEIVGWLRRQGLKNLHAQHLGGGYNHPFG